MGIVLPAGIPEQIKRGGDRMGLFDKKYCDFCGEKIGLLGNRKLADGNMCKDCAGGISAHLTGRRQYTVEDMKRHLADREENRERLQTFSPTRTFGNITKVHVDDNHGWLLVTSSSRYREENEDIIEFSQVTGCVYDVDENKTEQYRTDNEGKRVSYNPPRYEYEYDFYITINMNHPWFDQIKFKVNRDNIENRSSVEYRDTERQTMELKEALTNLHAQVREEAAAAVRPRGTAICSLCGATTQITANGCCEYCGAPIQA